MKRLLSLFVVSTALSTVAHADPPVAYPGTVVFEISVESLRASVIRHGSSFNFTSTMDRDFVNLATAAVDLTNPSAPAPLWDPVVFDDHNAPFAELRAAGRPTGRFDGAGGNLFRVNDIPIANSARQRLGIAFTVDSRNAVAIDTLFASRANHESTLCYTGRRAAAAAASGGNAERLPLSETVLRDPRCGALWRYSRPGPVGTTGPHCDGYTGFGELSFTGAELFQLTDNLEQSFTRTVTTRVDPTDCVSEKIPGSHWLQDSNLDVVIRVRRREIPVPDFGGACDGYPLRPATGTTPAFWQGTWSEGNWSTDNMFVTIGLNSGSGTLNVYGIDSFEKAGPYCSYGDVTSSTYINIVRPSIADPLYTHDRYDQPMCEDGGEVRPPSQTPADVMFGVPSVKLIAYQIGCGVPRVRYLRQAGDGSVLTDVMLHRYQPVR